MQSGRQLQTVTGTATTVTAFVNGTLKISSVKPLVINFYENGIAVAKALEPDYTIVDDRQRDLSGAEKDL